MKIEHFEKIKKELAVVALVIGVMIVVLKVVFYKEGLLGTLRMALSLAWLFLLPGYALLLAWSDELNIVERLIMGTFISAGLMGTASYYSGLFGLHIRLHAIVFPVIFILSGAVMWAIKERKVLLDG